MRPPLVIVGGGPAGSAAALTASRAGQRVQLLERRRAAAEVVCGCFLSAEAIAMLQPMGIDPDRLGASRINHIRLIQGTRKADARLPFAAHGLSRALLDSALLERAADAGVTVQRGVVVTSLHKSDDGVVAMARGGGAYAAGTLFLATGKHDIHGSERNYVTPPGNVALKQMFRLETGQRQALDGAIELYLFHGGYCGLQLMEDGIANLCLVVDGHVFRSLDSRWVDLIDAITCQTPLLGERLGGAVPCANRPLAVSRIPYGFLHERESDEHPALFRLGDQAAVIPSFSGDGVAIALWSGIAAARCWLSGGNAGDYHRQLRRTLSGQFRLAGWIDRIAANAFGRHALVATGAAFPATMRWAARGTRLAA